MHQKHKVEGGLYIKNTTKIQENTLDIHQNLKNYKNTTKSNKTLRLGRVPLEANGDLMAMV